MTPEAVYSRFALQLQTNQWVRIERRLAFTPSAEEPILLALNYRRMGKTNLFWPTLIWGFVATAALVTAAMFLPPRFPATVVNIILLFIMHAIAKHLQGNDLLMHQSRGGAMASNWLAVGIGLLSLIGVLIIAFVVLLPLFLLGYIE